jgi:hypothetical protein
MIKHKKNIIHEFNFTMNVADNNEIIQRNGWGTEAIIWSYLQRFMRF